MFKIEAFSPSLVHRISPSISSPGHSGLVPKKAMDEGAVDVVDPNPRNHMNEKEIWMEAYIANIQQGVEHSYAMIFAEAVLKRVVDLND